MATERKRALSSSWCILRDNAKLLAVIEYKIKQKKLSHKDLESLGGFSVDRISKLLRKVKSGRLTQYQTLTLCKILGISIDLEINIVD